MAGPAAKIAEARRIFRDKPQVEVHVDGGVSADTAAVVGGYGVTTCIVGSALFQRGRDTALEVQEVKRAAGNARYDAH
jgi:pentose-5-phosphate-3-epimerase